MAKADSHTLFVLDKNSLNDTIKNLKKFETRLVKKELRKIVKETGDIFLQDLKSSTPVDTGDLKRNLKQKVRTPRNRGGIHSMIGAKWIEGAEKNPYVKFWSLNPSRNKGAGGKRLSGAKSFGFAMASFKRKKEPARKYFIREMKNIIGRFRWHLIKH